MRSFVEAVPRPNRGVGRTLRFFMEIAPRKKVRSLFGGITNVGGPLRDARFLGDSRSKAHRGASVGQGVEAERLDRAERAEAAHPADQGRRGPPGEDLSG